MFRDTRYREILAQLGLTTCWLASSMMFRMFRSLHN
jgi:hypothetical protein